MVIWINAVFWSWIFTVLGFKSFRSACNNNYKNIAESAQASLKVTYFKGLVLQISNPKAILTFASVYSVFLPVNTSPIELLAVIISISIMANITFQLYAYLFSTSKVREVYFRLRRYFEIVFAFFFGITGYKILVLNLEWNFIGHLVIKLNVMVVTQIIHMRKKYNFFVLIGLIRCSPLAFYNRYVPPSSRILRRQKLSAHGEFPVKSHSLQVHSITYLDTHFKTHSL